MASKHNKLMIYVLNEDRTKFVSVRVKLDSPYISYTLGDKEAKKAASNLIVHHPEFLDRRFAPLWCSHDGKYIKTEEAVKSSAYRDYIKV